MKITAFILALVISLIAGCSNTITQQQPDQRSSPDTLSSEELPAATPSEEMFVEQTLRITNTSSFSIQHIIVRFPEDRVDFGEVQPGETTAYQVVPHGVFSYAAYDVEVDGQQYQQPVIDWIGEKPMNGKAFTYVLDVDPSKWKTEGKVILLIQVSVDL